MFVRSMFEYLMLGDVLARKYTKTSAHTRSILERFAFDTTLQPLNQSKNYENSKPILT